jgi:2'-5' RNA ligase
MRLFAAVVPADDAVEDLEEFLSVRREAGEFRWTLPEQWHITLAFAPHVPDRAVDDLLDRLARAGRRRSPFTVRIAGGGAFPNPARGRVLYGGIAGQDGDESATTELGRLATGARAAANKAGAEVEGARFRPHITLARVGRPKELTKWVRLMEGYRGPTWLVEEFALVASYLGEGPRKRPRYEVVETFRLGR